MDVNEKLTHIKFLIIIQSLFLSYNIPDTCKPMSDERKAHLLNKMIKKNYFEKKIPQIVFHLRQAHKSKHDIKYELIHE